MSQGFHRRLARHILLDLTPLRRSRDYRALIAGLGISVLGNQLTTVAVPFQVYAITRSSLVVGLVSLAQLFPLIFGSLLGGSLVDAVDRRKLLIVVEAIGAAASAGLALNADTRARAVAAVRLPRDHRGAVRHRQLGAQRHAARHGRHGPAARLQRDLPVAVPDRRDRRARRRRDCCSPGPGCTGSTGSTRSATWPRCPPRCVIAPQPPSAATGAAAVRPGWRSTLEGLRFVRRTQPVLGAYAIDLNAMVFGMPRALFPALAATVFGGGATTVGLLYSAPGAGALLGALTSGWVGRVRRQGLAVTAAVLVWGAAIAGFGLVRWLPARAGAARGRRLGRRAVRRVPQHDDPVRRA